MQKLSAGRARRERKGHGGQNADSAPRCLVRSLGGRLAPAGSGSGGERRQEVAELWHVARGRSASLSPPARLESGCHVLNPGLQA